MGEPKFNPGDQSERLNPRQTAASAGFATNGSTRELLRPPSELNALEKQEFTAVVTGSPANHFLPATLRRSASLPAVVGEKIADGELSAAPIIDGKSSPWLAIWISRVRAGTTLARRLNINPAGRVATKPSEAEPPISYYSKLAAERRTDDAN